jgi:hypothetical protein
MSRALLLAKRKLRDLYPSPPFVCRSPEISKRTLKDEVWSKRNVTESCRCKSLRASGLVGLSSSTPSYVDSNVPALT